MAVFASIYMIISGESYHFILELNSGAWFFLLVSCGLTIASQIAKKRGTDAYDVSQLQKANNMSTFWQFLVDFAVLGVAFSGLQYTGFTILFVIFAMEMGIVYKNVR